MSIRPKKPVLKTEQGISIYFDGPDLNQGPLPAIIYFALSAEATLYQDPFNRPAVVLSEEPVRVFSWNLPFHDSGIEPKDALHQWAVEFHRNPHFFDEFLEASIEAISQLIQEGFIHPQHIGVAGLSRGGFIATHLAARDPRLKYILGFAPLTRPRPLEEFSYLSSQVNDDRLALVHIADRLVDRPIRFYIGNRDVRVGTDNCYEFITHLVDISYSQGVRSPPVEMIMYPSIGHKGHGTPPCIFDEGAKWLNTQLSKQEV